MPQTLILSRLNSMTRVHFMVRLPLREYNHNLGTPNLEKLVSGPEKKDQKNKRV